MRAKLDMRAPRVAQIAAGVMLVAVPSALAATAPSAGDSVPATSAAKTHAKVASPATAAHKVRRHTKFRLALDRHASHAIAGHTIKVPGRLVVVKSKHKNNASAAAAPHRPNDSKVRLLDRENGHWRVVARTRTGPHGGFNFRYRVRQTGAVALRVRFMGSAYSHAEKRRDGNVTGLIPEVASWYYDGGNTACGFHATYGVANKTLPCGSRVTMNYGGRSVVATVDDRGPFVDGRDYDLNENTAAALGMEGVATIYASRS